MRRRLCLFWWAAGAAWSLVPPCHRVALRPEGLRRAGQGPEGEAPPRRRRWGLPWRRRREIGEDEALQLQTLGYTRAEIADMRPGRARRILRAAGIAEEDGGAEEEEEEIEEEMEGLEEEEEAEEGGAEAALTPEPVEVVAAAKLGRADLTDEDLWELAKYQSAMTRQFVRPAEALYTDLLSPEELEADLRGPFRFPDLPSFTERLKEESLMRLRVGGPFFAEALKQEARWRRDLYKRWLDFIDGEGVLPPTAEGAARTEDYGRHSPETYAAYVELKAEHEAALQSRRELADWMSRAKVGALGAPKERDAEGAS